MSKREDQDEFVAILEGIARDVLQEIRGEEVAKDPAAVSAFVSAFGTALRSRGLKVAHLNIVPGDLRS